MQKCVQDAIKELLFSWNLSRPLCLSYERSNRLEQSTIKQTISTVPRQPSWQSLCSVALSRPVGPTLPYDDEGTSCFLVHWTIHLQQYISCFSSYLHPHTPPSICTNKLASLPSVLNCGCPQGCLLVCHWLHYHLMLMMPSHFFHLTVLHLILLCNFFVLFWHCSVLDGY